MLINVPPIKMVLKNGNRVFINVTLIKTVLKNGNYVFIPAFLFAGATGANGSNPSRHRPIKAQQQ
jgi:hypothetical protein